MAFDQERVGRLLNQITETCARVTSEDSSAANQLRCLLQEVTMLDDVPDDLALLAASCVRSTRRILASEGDLAENLATIATGVSEIRSHLGQYDSPEVELLADPVAALRDETDDPLVGDFVAESFEHFQLAEEALLALGSEPTDVDQINAVFRAFHTVKGTAGILDLKRIGEFAHHAETLLDAARHGALVLEDTLLEHCFKALDMLRNLVEPLGTEEGSGVLPDEYFPLLETIRLACDGTADDARPAPTRAIEDETENQVEAQVQAASDKSVKPQPRPAAPAPTVDASAPEPNKTKRKVQAQRTAATVKVRTDRLDSLIDMVGELVISTAMVQQEFDGDTLADRRRVVGQLCKVTGELQSMAMSLRMVTLKATFQKTARLVRDLGRRSGKPLRFVTEGEDTELDRNVVEKLGDPLVHMLRNAVDHGLEDTPEDRVAAGKPAEGCIRIRGYHRAGNVVIEIADDGGGIDRAKLIKKAVANGVCKDGSERHLSDSEVLNLIFHPGLSTAEKVTDISGRGVGMDVVKRNVEELRGSIEIQSELGVGTTFFVRLPLTLAIIDGMVVRIGNNRYILPTLSIDNFVRPTPSDISKVKGKGEVLRTRGKILPIYRVGEIFGDSDATRDPCEGLLVTTEGEGSGSCALLVDDLIGQQHVVIKSMDKSMGGRAGISGAAILGDGTVGLIVDIVSLVRSARKSMPSELASV